MNLHCERGSPDGYNETDIALAGQFWLSPDIWNRIYSDGQQIHQNPNPQSSCTGNPSSASGPMNTIYVRLINRTCTDVTGDVNVYWSKAGTAMQWPNDWLPAGLCATSFGCSPNPVCSDHLLASTSSSTTTIPSVFVKANSEKIVAVAWCPPDPANFATCSYFAPFGFGHVCVMATFGTGSTGADPLILATNSNIWNNAKDFNNVAWKNMEIIDDPEFPNLVSTNGPQAGIVIRNVEEKVRFIKLNLLSQADKDGNSMLDFAKIRIHVTKGLMKRWVAGGRRGDGIIAINDSVFQITKKNAFLDNIFLLYRDEEAMAIQLIQTKTIPVSSEEYFNFDVVQSNAGEATGSPMGGLRYQIKKKFGTVVNCSPITTTLSGAIIGNTVVNGSVTVTGDVLVPSGSVLNFNNATVVIAENKKIKVMPGGKLVINASVLQSLCFGKKWAGIEVKGNTVFLNPLTITNSFISESSSPIIVEKAREMLISNSTFLGDNTGIAITLDRMKDFEISDNTFSNYATGIKTTKTDAAIVKSSIVRNTFLDVKVALDFSNDNHTKLDIKCNKFCYTDYAILSDNTLLKDQGVVGEGAGNEFISNSTLANNKVKHTSGNSPKYYYDPSSPITSGMNITTIVSATDPACYTSFDTTSVARVMAPSNIQDEIYKKAMDVYAVPNPNSGEATIYFSLGEGTQGELIIMDIYGKVIDRIKVNSGSNKVEVNYSQFSSGIYMISLTNTKGEVMNKKMIISK